MVQGKLRGRARITNFGENTAVCSELLGISVDSLAAETKINRTILIGLKFGYGDLDDKRIETIAEAMDIESKILLMEYESDEERREDLRGLLREEGVLPVAQSSDAGSEREKDTSSAQQTLQTPSGLVLSVDTPPVPEEMPAMIPVPAPSEKVEPASDEEDSACMIVSMETEPFYLKDRELRKLIFQRVRKLTEGLSYRKILKKAGLKRPASWLSDLKVGRGLITQEEIAALATACGVTLNALFTGKGIDTVDAPPEPRDHNAPAISASESSEFSLDGQQRFFQEWVLSPDTVLADNVSVGTIRVLMEQPAEDVNWLDAYLNITKEGKELDEHLRGIVKAMKENSPFIQKIILDRLNEVCRG